MTSPREAGARQGTPSALRWSAVLLFTFALLVVVLEAPVIGEELFATLAWMLAIGVSSVLSLPVLPRLRFEVDLSSPVMLAAALMLPPPAALCAVLGGWSTHHLMLRDVPAWSLLFNKAQIALSVAAASVVGHLIRGADEENVLLLVAAAAASALVLEGANTVFILLFFAVRHGSGPVAAVRAAVVPFPHFATTTALVVLLAVPIALAAPDLGVWAVLLIALPLALGYSALQTARESQDRAEQLAAQVGELQLLNELGERLLAVNDAEGARTVTERTLHSLLEVGDVQVALDGNVTAGLQVVKVSGVEPVALGVPPDLPEASQAVVEAAARLLGVILLRLELGERLADVQRARAELSQQILAEGARERNRIGVQIHDEALPLVAAADIQTDNVLSALSAGAVDRAQELARAAQRALTDSNRQLRAMLEQIHEQTIVPGGLVGWLEDTLDQLRIRHGIETNLVLPGQQAVGLPLPVEILLMEAARGCLTNVVRHAQACTLDVELRIEPAAVRLRVADDGVGFDPVQVEQRGHGLGLIMQRVELARGVHRIISAPGEGTVVDIEVPL